MTRQLARVSTISATADELDAAILTALRAAPGQSMWWADLRRQLPASTFWAKVEALTRLDLSGQVHVFKVGGRNVVDLGVELPPRARRPRSGRVVA